MSDDILTDLAAVQPTHQLGLHASMARAETLLASFMEAAPSVARRHTEPAAPARWWPGAVAEGGVG